MKIIERIRQLFSAADQKETAASATAATPPSAAPSMVVPAGRNRFLSGVVAFVFPSRHNSLRVQRHGAGHGKAGISYLEGGGFAQSPATHAQSGKTIAAFCRDESVSTASFQIWRSKLAANSEHTAQLAQRAAFIDLGTIASTADVTSIPPSPASTPVAVR